MGELRGVRGSGKHLQVRKTRWGIQVNKFTNTLRHAVGHTRDDNASVTVSNQHNIMEVLIEQYIANVFYVGRQADTRI